MSTPEQFFEERDTVQEGTAGMPLHTGPYASMQTWSLGMWKLAMQFASDYADRRELEVRRELTK